MSGSRSKKLKKEYLKLTRRIIDPKKIRNRWRIFKKAFNGMTGKQKLAAGYIN